MKNARKLKLCHTEFKILIKHLKPSSFQEGKVDRVNYTNFVSLNLPLPYSTKLTPDSV